MEIESISVCIIHSNNKNCITIAQPIKIEFPARLWIPPGIKIWKHDDGDGEAPIYYKDLLFLVEGNCISLHCSNEPAQEFSMHMPHVTGNFRVSVNMHLLVAYEPICVCDVPEMVALRGGGWANAISVHSRN